VTLGVLATQLGMGALTPDQVLTSTVTVGQVVAASSALLSATNPGASSSLSALGATILSKPFDSANPVQLGSALGLQAGNSVGLGTTSTCSRRSTTRSSWRTGTPDIAVPNLNVNVAGLVGASMSLAAIMPATVSPYGPVGIGVTNNQVTLNLTLDLSIPLVLTAHLPLSVTIGATGTLDAIDCTGNSPLDIKLGTQFQALNLIVQPGASVHAVLGLLGGPLSGNILIATNSVADAVVSNATSFLPNTTLVSPSLSLGTVTPNLVGTGISGLLAGLSNLLLTTLSPVVNAAVSVVSGLGINVGGVDYLGIQSTCATSHLVL
jgi:hypothetical protein